MTTLRIGTRASKLALWQAHRVRDELARYSIEAEIVPMTTIGDRQTSGPLATLGTQGVFTKEIQRALLENQIDLAVHSLKDLPTQPTDGLEVAAVPTRGDWRDAFVSPRYKTVFELPDDAMIGTGSLRRKCQLLANLPRLGDIRDVRGNVQTRLNKLDSGSFDALILAAAGLTRLGLADRIASYLEPPFFLPAPGQGALAVEIRSDDETTRHAVEKIDDRQTHVATCAERAFLEELKGGCIAPIAALATWHDQTMTLTGRIVSLDAARVFEDHCELTADDQVELSELLSHARHLGQRLAQSLLAAGADAIVEEILQIRRPDSGPDSPMP
ncbi:MAG: hydroxymethylbilane synthase [Planctomycetia bacterium]|nr:hydroxymethylbilane synthase [Planctomycetia bacterium]